MKPNTVLVSTPDLRPSLNSVLERLADDGYVGRLVSTIALEPSRWPALVHRLYGVLPNTLRAAISRRTVLPKLVGHSGSIPFREICRLLAVRFLGNRLAHRVWKWAEEGFDITVSRRYGGTYPIVYGMEYSSLCTFRRQKEAGGVCVLRQVNAHARFIQQVLREEVRAFPQYSSRYLLQLIREGEELIARKEQEYLLADFIICNSEFVRQSFIENGVNPANLKAVQTGCPPVAGTVATPGTRSRLRFVYLGSVSLRKGFPYLLNAWQQLSRSGNAELVVAGPSELPESVWRQAPPSIRYRGKVSGEEIKNLLAESDVLVLPTLCEGLAHSVLEGLSHGLPIITTPQSGCDRLVEDGVNGRIVPPRDSESLRVVIEWCLEHKGLLSDMGRASITKALSWTVKDSNEMHAQIFFELAELGKYQH